VLIANVQSRIVIGIDRESAGAAEEKRLGAAITTMLKTTTRTSLGSMARVNTRDAHTRFLGFVFQERARLSERPGVQPPLPLSLTGTGASADVLEVLNNDGSPRQSRLNDTSGQNVRTIPVESQLLARQLTQVVASGFRSFGLQGALESEVSFINILPLSLAQEGRGGCNGGMVEG
jgi:hypothetical protein